MTIKSDTVKDTDNLFVLFLYLFVVFTIFIIGLVLQYLGYSDNNSIRSLIIGSAVTAHIYIAYRTNEQIERPRKKHKKKKKEKFPKPLYDDEDEYDYTGEKIW